MQLRCDTATVPGMESDAAVYSTKQLADSLGLGAAMVRKYAVALEKLTGEDIPIKRRDGRQFSREHFDTISKAKALVEKNQGLNIETALKMSLGTADSPRLAPALESVDRNSLEMIQGFSEAISEATAKGNEPLIAELRELRIELQELREFQIKNETGGWLPFQGTAEDSAIMDKMQADAQKDFDSSQPSLIIRFAYWLDSVLRR